ncbi:MAG: MFS transporter, partial [Candidatus Hodarchaeota archaeon]
RSMVVPMAVTLGGIYLPLKKRGNAIGWLLTGVALAGLIGAPVIGIIAAVGGWQWAFLGFVLPIAVLSLMLTAKGVPSPARSHRLFKSTGQYLDGFKGVFSNRSATACLLGGVFGMGARQAIVLYGVSFFRQQFLITIEFATILLLLWSLCFIIGSLVGGRIINRLGRKPVTILAAIFSGIFIIAYTNVPNIWLALTLMFLCCVFTSMRATAINSLTLEQVPSFRGAMMSILAAAASMGAALGAGVGGLALLLFNYKVLGLILGTMSLIAGLIFYFWVSDPTRT